MLLDVLGQRARLVPENPAPDCREIPGLVMPDLRKNPQVIQIFRWSGPHICGNGIWDSANARPVHRLSAESATHPVVIVVGP